MSFVNDLKRLMGRHGNLAESQRHAIRDQKLLIDKQQQLIDMQEDLINMQADEIAAKNTQLIEATNKADDWCEEALLWRSKYETLSQAQ